MKRPQALDSVQVDIKRFRDSLCSLDKEAPINTIDPEYETESIANLVEACETAIAWLEFEIRKYDYEPGTRDWYDETGHKRNDF